MSPMLVAFHEESALGSMRGYAEALMAALGGGGPERSEPGEGVFRGGLAKIRSGGLLASVASFLGASSLRWKGNAWHVLDGSRAHLAMALPPKTTLVTAHDFIPVRQARGDFGAAAPAVGAGSRLVWQLNAWVMRRARGVICDSEATARDAVQLAGVERERCHVVQLPVREALRRAAAALRGAPRDRANLLHVGSSAFYKNRSQVVRVFGELAALDGSLRLTMVGPSPCVRCRAVADEYAVSSKIEWLTEVDDTLLSQCYARASLLLFPSLFEGYGWPVLEAMAFGTPVIASDRGSLPEILGPCGPGLAPEATGGWVREIDRLLGDEERRAALGEAARAHAAQFTSERFGREMSAVYREAFGAAGARG